MVYPRFGTDPTGFHVPAGGVYMFREDGYWPRFCHGFARSQQVKPLPNAREIMYNPKRNKDLVSMVGRG